VTVVTIKHVDGTTNDLWRASDRGGTITVPTVPIIRPDSSVFAMGSCFAVEIRDALRRRGFTVLPRYHDLEFDPAHQMVGKLPDRDNVNHYDTFTIRQEFEQAFGEADPPGPADFWRIDSADARSDVPLGGDELHQDPFRKRVFADSAGGLADLSAGIDRCIRDAVARADVFVITLGLIETWRDRATGRYLCRVPHPDLRDRSEFVLSDFASNLDNVRRVCSLIATHRPGTRIILTVSPVALGRTFTDRDIVVANMESKSVLRAVAGQVDREFDQVTYWPSYEIAMREDVFEDDGRHVTRQGVDKIVGAFLRAHCAD
jgi:hypothetical protein